MSSSNVVLAIAVFLASAVEMVEALTIVVAVGVSRGWRPALQGVAAAVAVLAVVVAVLGTAILTVVPLGALRLVVGAVLLVFGMQWLRKAVLRATGHKAKHDEDAIFAKQVERLGGSAGSDTTDRQRRAVADRIGFTVSFKGVFLEGLEVVIVVLTLGTASHDIGLAAASASLAAILVGGVGAAVSRQLSNVPENAMKMGVGLMLVSFGTFWAGEGLGMAWPGSDLAIPVLVVVYGAAAYALVSSFRKPKVGHVNPA
ncbi:MAG: hypothetical protein M0Z87_09465 [Actinomycetota bacterium]|nr:hypothetical protein [Actinomycetota bacterium]